MIIITIMMIMMNDDNDQAHRLSISLDTEGRVLTSPSSPGPGTTRQNMIMMMMIIIIIMIIIIMIIVGLMMNNEHLIHSVVFPRNSKAPLSDSWSPGNDFPN